MTREEFIERCLLSDKAPPSLRYLKAGIEGFKCSFYPEPQANWPEEEFERRIYGRYAIDEIMKRIMDDPFVSPVEVANSFSMEARLLKNETDIPQKSSMFGAIQEAAEDLYDYLRSMIE